MANELSSIKKICQHGSSGYDKAKKSMTWQHIKIRFVGVCCEFETDLNGNIL
jgi:hypothetical protein